MPNQLKENVIFCTYRKSSKETRGSYSTSQPSNAGLIRVCIGKKDKNAGLIGIRVLFEGESLLRIYGMQEKIFVTIE